MHHGAEIGARELFVPWDGLAVGEITPEGGIWELG